MKSAASLIEQEHDRQHRIAMCMSDPAVSERVAEVLADFEVEERERRGEYVD